jgi:hypothetical protein
MPIFRVEQDGRKFKVDAPDMAAAIEALGMHMGQSAGEKPPPKFSDALTDIPSEIKKAAGSAIDAMGRVTDRGKQGPLEGLATTGRAAMAVPELLLSPLTGTARSLIGHPMAQAEHAVGSIIAPDIAAKDDPQAMYETAKGDVDTAMSALATRGAPVAAAAPAPVASAGSRVVDAASRLSDVVGSDVNVPRAIASDSMAVQRAGQGIRNLPIVGDAIPQATDRLVENLGGAVRTVADQYGSGSGPNVANRIGRTVQGAADAETQAATSAAQRSDDALLAAWQNETDVAHQSIAAREASAMADTRQAVGDMSPQEMGGALIERLRAGELAARGEKEALYNRAGNMDASVRADEVGTVRARVAQGLEDQGTVVDKELTPAANKMLDELQRLSTLEIPNKAIGTRVAASGAEERVAVSVQGIEQARKRLNFFRSAATNPADRRAAGQIIHHFDEWQANAFENALFSGSDEALNAFRDARMANANWRRRFFNDNDDAGHFVTRIVTGEVTPQEVANYVVGAGQVGAKGVSSRLLTRIAEATNNDPEAMQAIRGGVWNRLSQAAEGVQAPGAAKVTNAINEFLSGSGSDVANRLFTPEQQGIMRAYAETLRRGQEARQIVADVSRNTKPQAMEVGPGPMQELADTVLGRGGKTDEALFKAIDAYARSGGKADISTLAKLVQAIPQADRTDLAGSVIRNLGVSPRTGQFSPDVFVSQWKTYTPQAKAVLFGNAGPQRAALDDIAVISDRLKQVGQKFGNPSGTAQNANFAAMGAGLIAAPLTTIASAVGSYGIARILAAPAGAASAAKWSKAYAAFRTTPTPQAIGLLQVMSRNLANTAQGLGIEVKVEDLIRALQTPQPQQDQQPQRLQVTR